MDVEICRTKRVFCLALSLAATTALGADDKLEPPAVQRGNVVVRMSKPVVVALSKPGETRWGHHQFPALSRLPDGRLWLTYNATADRDDQYGRPGPTFISADQGRNWEPARAVDPLLAISHSVVSPVGKGEFLCAPMSPGLSIETEKLSLPKPAARFNIYGEVLLFRLAECPQRVREFVGRIPALRWQPEKRAWQHEEIAWDTGHALVRTRKNDYVFTRPYLDNSLVSVGERLFYANYHLGYQLADGALPRNSAAWCMVSDDGGRSWQRHGLIAHDATGAAMMGEPSLVATHDGHLTCLIRCTDHRQRPLLITHSRDGGKTWEMTRELFPFGVMPQTLRLGNGVVVASFGRPGVHLAFAQDADARQWSDLLPIIAGQAANHSAHSCGYTRLVALDERSFLIAYSDFQWPDSQGRRCKAILVRRIEVGRPAARQ